MRAQGSWLDKGPLQRGSLSPSLAAHPRTRGLVLLARVPRRRPTRGPCAEPARGHARAWPCASSLRAKPARQSRGDVTGRMDACRELVGRLRTASRGHRQQAAHLAVAGNRSRSGAVGWQRGRRTRKTIRARRLRRPSQQAGSSLRSHRRFGALINSHAMQWRRRRHARGADTRRCARRNDRGWRRGRPLDTLGSRSRRSTARNGKARHRRGSRSVALVRQVGAATGAAPQCEGSVCAAVRAK